MAETGLALPDEGKFKSDIQAINRFQQVVHQNLIAGQDYGVIPGTQKPTLLKPGAEKIAKLLGLSDDYEIIDRQEDWAKPFFRYLIKCKLVAVNSGLLISTGLGECNSMESKYRWRWIAERDLPEDADKTKLVSQSRHSKTGGKWTVYRFENEDVFSQVNTILKMAKKRSLVDAALSAGRLSNVFTQDIEDIADDLKATVEPEIPRDEEDKSKVNGNGESPDLSTLEFKNPGEFYTACLKPPLKLSKSKVDAEIPDYDLTKVDQRKKAWQQILAIYGHRPEGKED